MTGGVFQPEIHAAMESQGPAEAVEIRIPQSLRMVPVDRQHPDRVLVVRGPAVLVLESDFHESAFRLPEHDDDLEKWLVEEEKPGVFRVVLPDGARALPFVLV